MDVEFEWFSFACASLATLNEGHRFIDLPVNWSPDSGHLIFAATNLASFFLGPLLSTENGGPTENQSEGKESISSRSIRTTNEATYCSLDELQCQVFQPIPDNTSYLFNVRVFDLEWKFSQVRHSMLAARGPFTDWRRHQSLRGRITLWVAVLCYSSNKSSKKN